MSLAEKISRSLTPATFKRAALALCAGKLGSMAIEGALQYAPTYVGFPPLSGAPSVLSIGLASAASAATLGYLYKKGSTSFYNYLNFPLLAFSAELYAKTPLPVLKAGLPHPALLHAWGLSSVLLTGYFLHQISKPAAAPKPPAPPPTDPR